MRSTLGILILGMAFASMSCQRNESTKVPRKDRAGLASTAPTDEVAEEAEASPAAPATETAATKPTETAATKLTETPETKPTEGGQAPATDSSTPAPSNTPGVGTPETTPPKADEPAPSKPIETGEFPAPAKPPVETGEFPKPPVETGEFPKPESKPETEKPAFDTQAFLESVKAELSATPKTVDKVELPEGGVIPFDVKTGQPSFAFSRVLKVRFPKTLNHGVAFDRLPEREKEKWIRIFAELRKASNFRDPEQPKYLFIDPKLARKASVSYEKDGSISLFGAWSIAVGATAVRYDFVDRPCAEFVSEMVRQAYKRAGYALGEDFNKLRGNTLIHESSHAVRGLSKALDKAGWIPWDASKYRPPVGAPAMHEMGLTPGHTYLAAGDNGLWIVDNSKPRGRDLRKTDPSYVRMMYKTGLFFLPPGLNPLPWDQAQ